MVFDTFTKDDILREGKWKGQELDEATLGELKNQAEALSKSLLWKILKAELQWYAVSSLLKGGEQGEDIRVARAFGNIVNVIDEKLKSM